MNRIQSHMIRQTQPSSRSCSQRRQLSNDHVCLQNYFLIPAAKIWLKSGQNSVEIFLKILIFFLKLFRRIVCTMLENSLRSLSENLSKILVVLTCICLAIQIICCVYFILIVNILVPYGMTFLIVCLFFIMLIPSKIFAII